MHRLRSIPSMQNLLLLMVLGLAGVAAESYRPADVAVALWPLAIAAGILGIALGLLRTPDSLSHLIAIATGFGVSLILAATRMAQDIPATSFRERLDVVAADLWAWYLGTGPQRETEDMLIGMLLQMVTWLGGYLAAWALVRQGWTSIALLIPGAVVLGTIAGGYDVPPRLPELYVVLAVMLLARTTYLRRTVSPSHRSTGRGRGWSSMAIAAATGMLIVSLGLATPKDFSTDTLLPMAQQASESYLRAQDSTTNWLEEHLGRSGAAVPGINDYPRYTAFDDAFSIGGDLNLTDQPEVLVRTAGGAPYLSAQSYDRYTGRGWESTVDETFNESGLDGIRYSPELTFRADQEIPWTSASKGQRFPAMMEVTTLGPQGETVFSNGQYLTTDERASVRMFWQQLDGARFSLRDLDAAAIPRDVVGVASMLLRADDLTVEGDSGLLYPSSAVDRDRLQAARGQLASRFIDVAWTVAADGKVDELIVTGQVPVYDDNVAVELADRGTDGSSYVVTSLVSSATEDELKAAPTIYPDWVLSRYLALPDTVTDRTVALSGQVTAGASNPFDQAKALEAFLRQHISYDLSVGIPPEDVDIVDWVLFEQLRGYCEHYASAMTVMLRALGVPARTVVGYFPGDFDQERNGYLYRQENAHAWTEAYFPGYGWIRFEPTASQPASAFDELPEPEPDQASSPTPTPSPESLTPAPTEEAATPTPQVNVPPIAEAVPETPDDGSSDVSIQAMVIGGLIVVSVLAVGWFVWALVRAPSLEPGALFGGLVRWGRAGGVADRGAETPREYAQQFGRRYPEMEEDAVRIVDLYEDHRYGGMRPDRSRLQQAAAGLRHLRRIVMRRMLRLGR